MLDNLAHFCEEGKRVHKNLKSSRKGGKRVLETLKGSKTLKRPKTLFPLTPVGELIQNISFLGGF